MGNSEQPPETPGIAFVVAGLGAGGAERVIALLADRFLAAGRAVTVIAFDHPGDPVYHVFDRRVRLLRLGGRRGGLAAVAGRVRRLRKLLAQEKFGVVFSFLTKINVISLLAAIGLPVAVVACERNNPQRQAAHPVWQQLLHRLYPRAAAIVLQTEASRACLPGAVAARARVIANPIAVPPGIANGPRPQRLVAVGRLEAQKGFDLLLEAFAQVAPRHPQWQLAIWGEGPLRAALEAQLAALGLAGRAALPGLSATPGAWLATTGVFVLSSRYEGFPNALAEAMAAGLPVVAFDCRFGPGELIRNRIGGVLVPEGDVSGLAAALDGVMGDSILQSRLGAAARLAAGAYAPDYIFGMWSKLERDVRARGGLRI
jgi:glycosyltransferase involved in cell wall biosynthesis